MVRGSVVTPEGALDETLYSSCIDGVEHVYYWRTAGASRISAVRMTEEACRGGKLLMWPPPYAVSVTDTLPTTGTVSAAICTAAVPPATVNVL